MLTSMLISLELLLLLISSAGFSSVNGCGQIQPGRERSVNFTVTNFKLPAVMAYSENAMARMAVTTLSATMSDVETFVRRLIMRPVEDVLYEQGRSAFLLDNVISSILQQLEVQISYEALKCDNVITDTMAGINMGGMMMNCIIIGGTVTNICTGAQDDSCNMANIGMNYKSIDSKHFSIAGSLKTSNAIMANWSNQMWQSVMNRVLRIITSGQYAMYFYGASNGVLPVLMMPNQSQKWNFKHDSKPTLQMSGLSHYRLTTFSPTVLLEAPSLRLIGMI